VFFVFLSIFVFQWFSAAEQTTKTRRHQETL